jgi:hypothetical protein
MTLRMLRIISGNAKVAGLGKDLNLVGLQYNIVAAVFFVSDFTPSSLHFVTPHIKVPYALFEVPSNIILKLIPPSKWSVYHQSGLIVHN